MSNPVVHDILHTEAQAQVHYAEAVAQREEIVRKAREDAMQLVLKAEDSFGTERERAIANHDRLLHERKAAIIGEAHAEAARIRAQAERRLADATRKLVARFEERLAS